MTTIMHPITITNQQSHPTRAGRRLGVIALSALVTIASAGCGSDETSTGAPDVSTVSQPAPDDTTPAPDGDHVVFVWTETGGCMMGGPNCARYEVTVNGTVQTFRLGTDDGDTADAEVTGQVDPALVQAWQESLADADLDAVRERVGPGELTAAFDGVDVIAAHPELDIELSSVETAFDPSEPIFAAATALAAAAAAAAPLAIEMR